MDRGLVAVLVTLFLGSALILCGGGCRLDSWDAPPKPTPVSPCALGVVCEDGNCCFEGSTCAGPHSTGVPAGMCEFIEPNDYEARRGGSDLYICRAASSSEKAPQCHRLVPERAR
jgi:hypothetical protein